MNSLHDIGEHESIRRLAQVLSPGSDVVQGTGDDCAVVAIETDPASDLLLTSDPVIEGTHFKKNTAPEKIGHKAIGRVLSDIAAMGGIPKYALANITAPAETEIEFLEKIYYGANQLAQKFSCPIVGGDLAGSSALQINVFCMGSTPSGTAILRSGAKPGDALCVSGNLGNSRENKHLDFVPRINQGIWLRENSFATAMIDLSDGLARDATHISEASGVAIDLSAENLPLNAIAGQSKDANIERALYEGEDFELLFTVENSKLAEMLKKWRNLFDINCTQIGKIIKGKPAVRINGRQVSSKEFRHF